MSGGQRQSAESEKRCGIGPQSHPTQRQPRKFTAQGVCLLLISRLSLITTNAHHSALGSVLGI